MHRHDVRALRTRRVNLFFRVTVASGRVVVILLVRAELTGRIGAQPGIKGNSR
jgi:hypothetical protein